MCAALTAGQYKPIHAVRFIIGGTIEERILKLQDKKRAVFEGTVGKDASALVCLLVHQCIAARARLTQRQCAAVLWRTAPSRGSS